MKINEKLLEFLLTFAIVFIVFSLVSFLYTLIAHGDSIASWQTALQMAIIFGIVVLWLNHRKKELDKLV